MRTALITTTVNIPKVLALYRKLSPDVKFFVAADEKTPLAAYEFCADIPLCEIYTPERQRELGYSCSELIGWSCVQRRNIALLEATAWGADVIVTIDDDNISVANEYFNNYFGTFQRHFDPGNLVDMDSGERIRHSFDGLKASSLSGWFDPGCLLAPQTKHRGFPIGIKSEPVFESVIDARIGVAAGLCLGDPDVDAVTRIATNPIIHSVSELGRAGVVVDMNCKTVFNSQNTAFIRELAPAMFMMPGVGRYDDIYASLICQRVMRERDLHVHFGQPFVWQQRNKHNLINDLRVEIDGMEKIERVGYFLDHLVLGDGTGVEQTRAIYKSFDHVPNSYDLMPKPSIEAALAFLDDIEKIL